ncbi:MAG TPA: hypothetical protein VGX25_15135 [Actinophytocola sp.]|uniref:hypothetical protein n=1 Tax=Actinophytocola sp. TaxID=1872138 RepID=UPI002DDD80A1|nr:hypothetical protein [Actinophytocola sp.]HEV2780722.1 hypothetical protein [Actinophytocola sp.]
MYLDPSEGRAGATLNTVSGLYGAATSGALKVDPTTGETTLRFLNQVQDMVDAMLRRSDEVGVKTPLGGGFAEEVGAFNQRLASGGPRSAKEVLTTFRRELEELKAAVAASMAAYRSTEAGNARTVTAAGGAR